MSALGPAVGFLMGATFLSIYVDPHHTPDELEPDSATWVGAWWMGHLVCSLLALMAGIAFMFFPRSLPKKAKTEKELEGDQPMVFSLGKNLRGLLLRDLLWRTTFAVSVPQTTGMEASTGLRPVAGKFHVGPVEI